LFDEFSTQQTRTVKSSLDTQEFHMGKPYIALQPSEGIIVQAAATIYAGYLTAGRVPEGSESDWIARSIKDAIRIAQTTDENVQSDNEVM
jgi:hypothetical protein